jgi:hypothetical protein
LLKIFHKVFLHPINVNAQKLTLSHLKPTGRPLRNIDGEILNVLVIDFKHGGVDLILLPLFLLGCLLEKFIATDWDNSLSDNRLTLFYPYPIIE